MEAIKGTASYKGIAIGRIAEMEKDDAVVRRAHIDDADAETVRYVAAKEKAQEQLMLLKDKALKEAGEAQAEIFEAHSMFLDDFDDSVINIIRTQMVNAEYAVAETGDNISEMLSAMEDNPYMQA